MKQRIGPFEILLRRAERRRVVLQLAHRDVLDDALLHLLEAVVILVEAAAHVLGIELVLRRLAPRQIGEPLEVRAGHVVLRRLLLHPREARELLASDLLRILRETRAADAVAQLLDLVFLARLAELLADVLHLLAEDLLALRLALVLDHRAHLAANAEHLELVLRHREHEAHARLRVEGLEHLLFVRDRRLLGREVRRDEIGERAALAHVVEDRGDLLREVRREREHLAHGVAEARAEQVELGVALEVLGDALDARAHVRLERDRRDDLHAREAVEDDRVVLRAEADDLHDARDGADVVDLGPPRLVHVAVALAHDSDDRALLRLELLHQPHAAHATHVDRHHARGKHHAVSER